MYSFINIDIELHYRDTGKQRSFKGQNVDYNYEKIVKSIPLQN